MTKTENVVIKQNFNPVEVVKYWPILLFCGLTLISIGVYQSKFSQARNDIDAVSIEQKKNTEQIVKINESLVRIATILEERLPAKK